MAAHGWLLHDRPASDAPDVRQASCIRTGTCRQTHFSQLKKVSEVGTCPRPQQHDQEMHLFQVLRVACKDTQRLCVCLIRLWCSSPLHAEVLFSWVSR